MQVVKPTPIKDGGAEAVAIEDIASTSACFCLTALDDSPAADFLQYITYHHTNKT
jgi:hypothetical protein